MIREQLSIESNFLIKQLTNGSRIKVLYKLISWRFWDQCLYSVLKRALLYFKAFVSNYVLFNLCNFYLYCIIILTFTFVFTIKEMNIREFSIFEKCSKKKKKYNGLLFLCLCFYILFNFSIFPLCTNICRKVKSNERKK